MLETRALFISLTEDLERWHLCGIHIGATRDTWRQVNKLEGRSGGQRCKKCGRCERCEKCEGFFTHV